MEEMKKMMSEMMSMIKEIHSKIMGKKDFEEMSPDEQDKKLHSELMDKEKEYKGEGIESI